MPFDATGFAVDLPPQRRRFRADAMTGLIVLPLPTALMLGGVGHMEAQRPAGSTQAALTDATMARLRPLLSVPKD